MNLNPKRLAGHFARPAFLAAAAVVVASVVSILPAARVSAHAAYDHSTPGDGEVLAESPEKIDVYFKEEMSRSGGLPTLVVVNSSGDTVSSNAALDDDDRTHLTADLNPGLPDGRYTAIWHNVSADDGDEAEGAFFFYIGAGPTATTPGGTSGTPSATEAPTATTAPVEEEGDGGDVSIVVLILGIIGGLAVGGGGGLLIGRMGSR
jgi:copper transport protein